MEMSTLQDIATMVKTQKGIIFGIKLSPYVFGELNLHHQVEMDLIIGIIAHLFGLGDTFTKDSLIQRSQKKLARQCS